MKPFAITLLSTLMLAPSFAGADERPYAFTYEPVVSAGGEAEVELYETLSQPRRGGDRSWEHQLEVGYGLTDRLSISGYGVFQSTPAASFELKKLKLEGRYKLLDASQSPVELVLYLEGNKEVVEDRPWAIEEKLILGRNYGRLGWALNLAAEQEFPSGGGHELVYGWSFGTAVALTSHLRVGAETFGERATDAAGVTSWEAFAGPSAVVTLPAGPLNSAWLIVGAGFGLREENDRVRVRVILGADF